MMVSRFPESDARASTSTLRAIAPSEQPMRRMFGVSRLINHGCPVDIVTRDAAKWPFCALSQFHMNGLSAPQPQILLVSPLSGHYSFILRELVAGLALDASVSVTDWLNARFIPLSEGDFGFDDNIDTILQSVRILGRDTHIIALCQGAVPALAATAILSQDEPALAPASLTLMAGPVDPLANPTRVVRLLRQRPLRAIEASALDQVASCHLGAGRLVYPAHYQLSALLAYLSRHVFSGGELLQKVMNDDGLDPIRFPFLELFTSLMDLPAKYFIENIQKVFLERQAWTGGLWWRGMPVDFAAIHDTALLTIEGADDDIAAPGQTSAAHRLCTGIPPCQRRNLILKGAGHFSLFHGTACRGTIVPEIKQFVADAGAARSIPAHRTSAKH